MSGRDFVELTDAQVSEFKEVFKIFDADGNGTICITELGIVMRALGQTPTDQELKEIMDDFDENRDGVISFEEFLGLMVVLINKVDEVKKEDNLLQAFRVFDKDMDGFISCEELKDFFHGIGEQTLTDCDIQEMIKGADMNNDGKLDFQEFKSMMCQKTKDTSEEEGRGHEEWNFWPPKPKTRIIDPTTFREETLIDIDEIPLDATVGTSDEIPLADEV